MRKFNNRHCVCPCMCTHACVHVPVHVCNVTLDENVSVKMSKLFEDGSLPKMSYSAVIVHFLVSLRDYRLIPCPW